MGRGALGHPAKTHYTPIGDGLSSIPWDAVSKSSQSSWKRGAAPPRSPNHRTLRCGPRRRCRLGRTLVASVSCGRSCRVGSPDECFPPSLSPITYFGVDRCKQTPTCGYPNNTMSMMRYLREAYCTSFAGKYGVEFWNDLMLIQKVQLRITKILVPNLWYHDKQANNPHFTMLLNFLVGIYMHQGVTFSDGVPCQEQRFT